MKLATISLVLLILLLSACSPQEGAGFIDLEPKQVADLIEGNTDLFILNVHTPYEGKLEGTDAFIEDWQNIAAHQDELPKDKGAPLLVYCRTGRMSTSAVQQLQELGYTNITHLKGGMVAYDAAGFEVIDKSWK
ncbi:rhodanese-like domain-containing protein [Candidatus Woesearchaeota archaeon]|nr:MAG: rhodanese-like domain-containing protein [Candidatus Woesearchaeota archaeon]